MNQYKYICLVHETKGESINIYVWFMRLRVGVYKYICLVHETKGESV